MARVPMGMFLVMVDPESKGEKLLGVAAMEPYFIVCALVTLIVRCRELLVCFWFLGHILNEALNFFLKRLFKEQRPEGAPAVGFDGHGMPSAHSQFMGFYFAFSSAVLLFRIRDVSLLYKLLPVAFNLLLSVAVVFGRVHLGFHTEAQVIVGLAVGFLFGGCYYAFLHLVLFPRFPAMASWSLSKFLMLRDCQHVDNVIQAEYDFYASRRKKRA
mmetsp:Transcript_28709/g.65067  ORF Transcript_28709/g.65067 Transcript_28709/m.65067 type:complete len:214 (-) Transcript_28709:31-672(-)